MLMMSGAIFAGVIRHLLREPCPIDEATRLFGSRRRPS
jgi:hypothetical protein